MNSKMLLAFVGGLIVASGVTYIAMRRDVSPPIEVAQVKPSSAPSSATPAAVEPAPVSSEPAAVETRPEPAKKASPSVSRAPRQVARTLPPPVVKDTPTAPQASPAPETQAPAQVPPPAAEIPKPDPAPRYEAPAPPPPQPHTVAVPSGTTITVRLSETLSSERNHPGDQFTAVLDQPIVVDGFVIAERGARAQGRIVELERAGKIRGVSRMAIELTHVHTSDGQNVRINTSAYNRQGETSRTKDAAKVGGGAALGAIIGAIAGGGKGAAIGAGVGGAAGAGDVALTRGQAAELKVETRVSFRLAETVNLTERLH